MPLSRRDFLKLGGLAAATLAASSCQAVGRRLAQSELPESLATPAETPPSPLLRLLNRAGYGPRPGDLQQAAALGFEAYLESQLDPAAIDDTPAELLLRNQTNYNMDISELLGQDEPRDSGRSLIAATMSQAAFSKRQLYQAMVEFWSDHFNIYIRKNQFMVHFKIIDDREVIRPHALGKFRDLLLASAKSPAMLIYLDNVANEKGRPNENYARELMELHTLGVHGGYTQNDVQNAARILTGWSTQRRGPGQGQFRFYPALHDDGPKEVLGQLFPAGGGEQEVYDLLELLLNQPATATFIATKLVRRFVADEPPAGLVQRVAQSYQANDGDIKAMLRTIFLSDEFANAPPKLKRPFTFMISAFRTLHADLAPAAQRAERGFDYWLPALGQPPFMWPPPNGYPDVAPAWAANLLPRWNFALQLTNNQLPGVSVPFQQLLTAGNAQDVPSALDGLALLILNRPLDEQSKQLFNDYVGGTQLTDTTQIALREIAALLLACPSFQWV